MSWRRSRMLAVDQRTGRKVRGATLVEDGEITGLRVARGEDDPPHPLSQPFSPGVDRVMLLGSRLNLEPADNNLLSVTEGDFTASPWVSTYLTQTQNAIYAPNGTLTATQLLETADADDHIIEILPSGLTSGVTYCASLHVKPIDRTNLWLYYTDTDWNHNAWVQFDMQAQSVVDAGNDDTSATVVAYGAQPLRDGWSRVWLAASIAATTIRAHFALGNHAGDTAKGFHAWGAKFERGSVPSPYASVQEIVFR